MKALQKWKKFNHLQRATQGVCQCLVKTVYQVFTYNRATPGQRSVPEVNAFCFKLEQDHFPEPEELS